MCNNGFAHSNRPWPRGMFVCVPHTFDLLYRKSCGYWRHYCMQAKGCHEFLIRFCCCHISMSSHVDRALPCDANITVALLCWLYNFFTPFLRKASTRILHTWHALHWRSAWSRGFFYITYRRRCRQFSFAGHFSRCFPAEYLYIYIKFRVWRQLTRLIKYFSFRLYLSVMPNSQSR